MPGHRAMASLCLFALALLAIVPGAPAQRCQGQFRIMGDIGISPITVSQSVDGYLYLFDRRDLQNSKIRLPDGSFGHAVEYNPRRNTWRTISSVTNTWCSAGGYLKDGTIMNTAGNDAGLQAVRFLKPCSSKGGRGFVGGAGPPRCNEWWEDGTKFSLAARRWYPTDQVLPDGRHILIGGSSGSTSPRLIVPTYEFIDPYAYKTGPQIDMPFLREGIPNYLYPFVHLLPTDLLFIFVNVKAIIFNYKTNQIVRRTPDIPDGISRTYPATGASLLLPLSYTNRYQRTEILICGGNQVTANARTPASNACYVINVSKRRITTNTIVWKGPYRLARGRVMPDLLFLMDGSFLIINGAERGVAGFSTASVPNLAPEVLSLNAAGGIVVNSNFCPSTLARGYHSEAILIPDGRVFISGSNAWPRYTAIPGNPFSTEYRIEMWQPPYVLQAAIPRPIISGSPGGVAYNIKFRVTIGFTMPATPSVATVRVALVANGFVTHSISMNLRYIILPFTIVGNTLTVTSPPSAVIAPPGPYMLTVIYRGIPSYAKWLTVG